MKTTVVLAALSALLFGMVRPAVAQRHKDPTPPLTVTRLPNGLTVVMARGASPGTVAYYTLMRVGSRNEVEPGHSGFAHLFEHMMFFGTKAWPREKWEAAVAEHGLSANAFTSDDRTVYHLVGPAAALPFIIETEADRFQNLAYDQAGFQTETKAVLGEYNKSFANPTRKMSEVLRDKAFDRHTYKHTTMGFLADIKAMPGYYDYSRDFFRRYYRPDNATIFIVGDFDHKATLALIKQHYGSWKGKADRTAPPAELPQRAERRANIEWPAPTHPRIMVGYHTPAATLRGKDTAVMNLIGPLLFGKQSALYRDLVLTRQLCEDLDVWYSDHRDPGLFVYLATLKSPKQLAAVQQAIDAAIADLRAGKLDAKQLEAVQSNLRYGLLMDLETPAQIAGTLAVTTAPTGDPHGLAKLMAQIERVKVRDVVAFAKKHLDPKNRTVVTLTAKGGAR